MGLGRMAREFSDRLTAPRDAVYCVLSGVRWHPSWRLIGLPLLQRHWGSRLQIGKSFVACSLPERNSLGVFQRVILKTTAPGAELVIGDRVGLSGCTISAALSIRLGDDVLVGSGALITDSDAHPLAVEERGRPEMTGRAPVMVGNGVFIGARAIVLKGVTLGEGCVVGAGAVVTRDVPAGAVVAGNPARQVAWVARPKEL